MKTNNEHPSQKAYSDILKVLKKYKDLHAFDIDDLERKAKHHLFGIELKEKYGLNIDPKKVNALDYNKFGEYGCICWYGEKYNRTISWSDDGSNPTDELLYKIGFSTGAYIFGDDYPTDLFHKFFMELASYGPKYKDSHNKSLYFTLDSAADIFNNFSSILKKYYEWNKEDYKQRKIQKMKADLAKLEGN